MLSSNLEHTFALILRSEKIQMEREYRFHPERKWRFDFADPKRKIAVEIEGGAWAKGRHTRGAGFVGDCEKYNEAILLGWKVLRYPTVGAMAEFPHHYRVLVNGIIK